MWIRSPWWDGFWILSGLPIGGVMTGLTILGIAPQTIVFWLVLLTQTGHLLSPLGLAWTHDGFRQIMRRQPAKYITIPTLIVIGVTLAAYGSSYLAPIQFDPVGIKLIVEGPWWVPLQVIALIYALWNAYHFGMQAFGVMSIYRRKYESHSGGIGANVQRPHSSSRPTASNDGSAGTYLRRSVGNVLGIVQTSLRIQGRRRPALQASPTAQRKIDMVYCCGVTWATMLYPFIPVIAKASHGLIGWPVAPHPFLDRMWLVYTAVVVMAMSAMLLRERCLPRALFILTDGLGMLAVPWFGLWVFAIVAMNHWLVAIGLASHTQKKYPPSLFALALMVSGMALFCFLFMDLRTGALAFTVTAVGFRLGCGFVHFVYDRWLYQFSKPEVRATIGRDLFGQPQLRTAGDCVLISPPQ